MPVNLSLAVDPLGLRLSAFNKTPVSVPFAPCPGAKCHSYRPDSVLLCCMCLVGASDFFDHLAHQPLLQLIVLANSIRKQIYIFHYHTAPDASTAACDYATCYSLQKAMLNFTTAVEAVESQAVPGTMIPGQLLLYAMQTDAVQQYYLDPATCKQPEEDSAAAAGFSSPGPAAAAAASAASSSAPAAVAAAPAAVAESPSARLPQHGTPPPAAGAVPSPPPVPTALMGSASPPGTPSPQPASPIAANNITAPTTAPAAAANELPEAPSVPAVPPASTLLAQMLSTAAAAAGGPSAKAADGTDKEGSVAAAQSARSKKAAGSSSSSSSAAATAGPPPGMPPMPTSKLTKQASLQHEEKAMSRQASPALPATVEGSVAPSPPAAVVAAAAGLEGSEAVQPALADTVIVAPAAAVPDVMIIENSRAAAPAAEDAAAVEGAQGRGEAGQLPAGALVVSSVELAALKQQLGVLIGMQRELAAQQGELAAQLTAGTEQIRTGEKTGGCGCSCCDVLFNLDAKMLMV